MAARPYAAGLRSTGTVRVRNIGPETQAKISRTVLALVSSHLTRLAKVAPVSTGKRPAHGKKQGEAEKKEGKIINAAAAWHDGGRRGWGMREAWLFISLLVVTLSRVSRLRRTFRLSFSVRTTDVKRRNARTPTRRDKNNKKRTRQAGGGGKHNC